MHRVVQDVTGSARWQSVFSASGRKADESRSCSIHIRRRGRVELLAERNRCSSFNALDAKTRSVMANFSSDAKRCQGLLRSGLDERAPTVFS